MESRAAAKTVELKMSDDSHRLSIKPLDGSNWMTWKIQMKHLFLDRDLWGHVTGDATPPEDAQLLVKFKKAAQKANTMLYLHVAQSQIYVIGDEEKPTETWKKLSDHFERGTVTTKLHLRKQYFKCEMREGASVQDHIKKMREITDKLAVMNSPIIEEDQVMTLLGSLPSSYDSLVATLGVLDDMKLSMVERSILDEEIRKEGSGRADSSGATAMYGKSTASADRKKSGKGGKPGSWKAKVKCYSCKKLGHFQRDCMEKKADRGSSDQQAHLSSDKEVAFVATADKVGAKKSQNWIIDSGASRHMTWDRAHLEDYRALDSPELVRLGDNRTVEGEGIGKVRIRVVRIALASLNVSCIR